MFFLALWSLLALSPAAARAECLDAKAVAALRADIQFEAPEGAALPKYDLCEEGSTGYAAFRALLFLKELPPLALPKSEFNHNFIDGQPYDFFKARVKKIVVVEQKDNEACADGRLAYVSPVWREEKMFWVCPNAANFGVITLGSAFIHESRHEEGAVFDHRECYKGPYARQFSCDQNYEAGGAYAIGLEFLVKLSRAEGLPAEIRRAARSLALADFLQRFNEAPLGLAEGALLRDETGKLTFFDGEKESDLGLGVNPNVVLSTQAGLPLFFDPAQEAASIYAYRAGELSAPVSDVLTRHFAEALSPAEKSELRDVLYTNAYACLLLKGGLRCYGPDRAAFAVPIKHTEAKRFVYGSRSRILGQPAILGADGFLYQMPRDAASLRASDPARWPKSSEPAKLLAADRWPEGELALGVDGSLSTFSYREKKLAPLPSLTGRKFLDFKAPFLWSKKLEEL